MAAKYLVKNKAWTPLVISLPGGKSITVPARDSVTLSAEDVNSPECQRLLNAGTLMVLSEIAEQ
jgi:hypothetical protein